jgi:hypothetical protein
MPYSRTNLSTYIHRQLRDVEATVNNLLAPENRVDGVTGGGDTEAGYKDAIDQTAMLFGVEYDSAAAHAFATNIIGVQTVGIWAAYGLYENLLTARQSADLGATLSEKIGVQLTQIRQAKDRTALQANALVAGLNLPVATVAGGGAGGSGSRGIEVGEMLVGRGYAFGDERGGH